MEALQAKITQVERELNAIKFILEIGGEENDLVSNFRRWNESKLQDTYNQLQGIYKELQAKENILLAQQQKTGILINDLEISINKICIVLI